MKKLFYFLSAIVLLTSCTIEQHTHFKDDWSGSNSYTIDMSAMMAALGDSTRGMNNSGNTELKTALKALDSLPGITNAVLDMDDEKGIYKVSFDFSEVKLLNQSTRDLQGQDANALDSINVFRVEGKTLFVEMPNIDAGRGDEGLMGGIGDMMKFKMILSFDKPVKKLETANGAILSDDKKKITWAPDYSQLAKPPKDGNGMKITVGK